MSWRCSSRCPGCRCSAGLWYVGWIWRECYDWYGDWLLMIDIGYSIWLPMITDDYWWLQYWWLIIDCDDSSFIWPLHMKFKLRDSHLLKSINLLAQILLAKQTVKPHMAPGIYRSPGWPGCTWWTLASPVCIQQWWSQALKTGNLCWYGWESMGITEENDLLKCHLRHGWNMLKCHGRDPDRWMDVVLHKLIGSFQPREMCHPWIEMRTLCWLR